MASSKDFSAEGSVTGYSDEDFRGDGKKRKFKPLSAMKKFFTKKRDKKDSVVAVKATSTTVLHSGYRTDEDEDEDDGGFKSHRRPLALAGNRSLSEDSVFSPEPRAQSIAVFPKAAISDESLPKSAFQSELLSKLNKRRSQYSDDDHDDGLPRSPVPPVTTADVIMSGQLKKQIGPSGKTSNIRGSDQSLISVDTSENEEDLFLSKWKSSVPAKKSSAASSAATINTMDTLDLNSIQRTELLVSSAAKDKIMVKPKRKGTAKQQRRHRDTSSPTPLLPSLNEESPTRSKPEDVMGSWISGSTAKSPVKPTLSDEKQSSVHANQAPLSTDKTGPSVKTSGKHNLSSITISPKESNAESPLTSPTLSPPVVVSATAVEAVAPPPKVTTPTSPIADFSQKKTDSVLNSADKSLSTSSPNLSVDVIDVVAASSNIHENFSVSERGDKTIVTGITDASVSHLSQSHRELNENKSSLNIKSRMSHFQTPLTSSKFDTTSSKFDTTSSKFDTTSSKVDTTSSKVDTTSSKFDNTSSKFDTTSSKVDTTTNKVDTTTNKVDTTTNKVDTTTNKVDTTSSKFDTTSSNAIESLVVKSTDPDSQPVVSPKEEYKSRRQTRSKTLPAVVDEQRSPKVQRSRSDRIQNSETILPDPQEQPMQLSNESTILSTSTTSAPVASKRPEHVKFSSAESTISAGEPSWMNMVRKRKDEQEIKLESEKTKVSEAVPRSSATLPAPKSVFTSASYLEKKRGSIETSSSKNRELSEHVVKKSDSDGKRQSVDLNSQNKASVTDASSAVKESTEIDITKLGSIKTSRSIFDSVTRSGSQKDSTFPTSSTTPATAERIRTFSGSSSAMSASSSSSVKPVSNVSQEPASSTPGSIDNAKSSVTSSSITHIRGGSVKASAKTSNVKSTLYTRTGSIKASATGSSLPSETELTSVPSKAGTTSTFKPDHSGAPLVQPSIPSSAPHAPMHVAAQPNTSLPSQTSSAVTTSNEKVASTVASNEKPAAEVKKVSTTARVPAWRTHLTSKEVKIEIIENAPSSAPPPTSQTSSEILRKGPDKSKLHETIKKTEGPSSAESAMETEKSRRSSKVLDMVKNFQNLQAPA